VQRRAGLRRTRIRRVGAIDFDSGVTAGTYGDSTDVGQFTVDEFGRVVAAHNVPIALPISQLLAIPANTIVANPTGLSAVPVGATPAQLRAMLGSAGRTDLWRQAQGFVAETVPHQYCHFVQVAPNTPVSGVVYVQEIFLLAGDVLTTGYVQSASTIGGAMTLGQIGVYDFTNGNLHTTGTSSGAAWLASGLHPVTMVPQYTAPTTGIYYTAVLMLFTTGFPSLLLSSPSLSVAAGAGLGTTLPPAPFYQGTHFATVSTLPAVIGGSTIFSPAFNHWVGFAS
jgi:hypothetical protein